MYRCSLSNYVLYMQILHLSVPQCANPRLRSRSCLASNTVHTVSIPPSSVVTSWKAARPVSLLLVTAVRASSLGSGSGLMEVIRLLWTEEVPSSEVVVTNVGDLNHFVDTVCIKKQEFMYGRSPKKIMKLYY